VEGRGECPFSDKVVLSGGGKRVNGGPYSHKVDLEWRGEETVNGGPYSHKVGLEWRG
jgi:hypothetical protein